MRNEVQSKKEKEVVKKVQAQRSKLLVCTSTSKSRNKRRSRSSKKGSGRNSKMKNGSGRSSKMKKKKIEIVKEEVPYKKL
jgi:hypothetical protein